MKRWACLVAIGAVALVGQAQAAVKIAPLGHWERRPAVQTQTLTVINQAHVPAADLAAVERAVVSQSRQLQRWWHTPVVRFGTGGWPIRLEDSGWMLAQHTASPAATISWIAALPKQPPISWWSVNLSHEVMEMLADPTVTQRSNGLLREVCDPVASHAYRLDGVWVQDFVTPAWFTRSRIGPWDEMRKLDGF